MVGGYLNDNSSVDKKLSQQSDMMTNMKKN